MMNKMQDLSSDLRHASVRDANLSQQIERAQELFHADLDAKDKELSTLQAHLGQREVLWEKETETLQREAQAVNLELEQQCSRVRAEAQEVEREMQFARAQLQQQLAALQQHNSTIEQECEHVRKVNVQLQLDAEDKCQGYEFRLAQVQQQVEVSLCCSMLQCVAVCVQCSAASQDEIYPLFVMLDLDAAIPRNFRHI